METKSLLYGLIGFFIGGLLVSAAATFEKPTMDQMTTELRDLKGDEYDKAFTASMIRHHQAAVDMARLSPDRAKHQEVKDLSAAIITAQEREMRAMTQWQQAWGYALASPNGHGGH